MSEFLVTDTDDDHGKSGFVASWNYFYSLAQTHKVNCDLVAESIHRQDVRTLRELFAPFVPDLLIMLVDCDVVAYDTVPGGNHHDR